MRINFVLFNFLLLIFLGTLIYLYFYINYSTFEGFADIDTTRIDNTGQLAFEQLPATVTRRDGSKPNLYLLSAQNLLFINEYNLAESTSVNTLGNGYYWINLPVVGPKLIYCIADKNFFGGGWMLAMRSIFYSKTFGYTSKHWTYNSTLNASSAEIGQKLPSLLGTPIINTDVSSVMDPIKDFSISEINNRYNTENKYKYSSVGKNLYYTPYVSKGNLNIPIDNFDCKLDTYNYFRATEIMVIFYLRSDANDFKGGDGENNVGWVWTQKINKTDYNFSIQPTLLELFQYLENSNKEYTNMPETRTLTKFKKQGAGTKSPIWYSTKAPDNEKAFSFYGFNYKKGDWGSRIGFSFGSENKITAVNGVGIMGTYETKDDKGIKKNNPIEYSGGRGISDVYRSLKDDDSSELFMDFLPISYEIYVK